MNIHDRLQRRNRRIVSYFGVPLTLVFLLLPIAAIADAPEGDLLWAIQGHGVGSWTGIADMDVSLEGRLLMLGVLDGVAEFGVGQKNQTSLDSNNDLSLLIAQYDAEGRFLWVRQVARQDVWGIALDDQGNSLVLGALFESMTFGAGEPAQTTLEPSQGDAFLAKYAPDGMLIWARAVAELTLGKSVMAVDHSGNILCADRSGLIAKFGPDGALQWTERVMANGEYYPADIETDADGHLFLLGNSGRGAITFGTGGPREVTFPVDSDADIFLAAYAPDGALRWANACPGNNWAQSRAMAVDSVGDVVLTGRLEGFVTFGPGEPNETQLGEGGFLAKYGSDGHLRWAVKAHESDLALDSENNIFLAGPLTKYDPDGIQLSSSSATARLIDIDAADHILLADDFWEERWLGAGTSNEVRLTLDGWITANFFVAKYSGSTANSSHGDLLIGDKWTPLCLPDPLHDAVVLLGAPTQNGWNPGVVRMREAQEGGCQFEVRFQEWDYRARDFGDHWHQGERVAYLALAPGVHQMPDGSRWEVGSYAQWGTGNWKTVRFQADFEDVPFLFLTMQSTHGPQAATVRARNVGAEGFESAIFEEEALMDGHAIEEIGYLAISPPAIQAYSPTLDGILVLDGLKVPYSISELWVDDRWVSERNTRIRLQEEQSLDEETQHRPEILDVLRIGDNAKEAFTGDAVFVQQVTSFGWDTTSPRRQ